MVQVHEKRTGPFKVGESEFTVLLKVLKWQGPESGFDETVKSITIVDDGSKVHFRKSFRVQSGETGFSESVGVSVFALDSWGLRGFTVKTGELKEVAPTGKTGAGLIIYYGITPTAPLAGTVCQVLALKEGRLEPLFSPLTVYGRIYELPPGSTPDSRKLFEGDTMRFGVWTGWFEVIVPVKVFDNLRIVPLHYNMTSGHYAFEAVVSRRPSDEDTFVRLFHSPEEGTIPKHVIVRKDSRIEFLLAYGKPAIRKGEIVMDGTPWLKVRIDGREGYVRAPEDLMALGLRQAG